MGKFPFARKHRSAVPTIVSHQTRRRRDCGLRLLLEALESRVTPALMTFAPGAYLIDMGQPTQTVGNALKPYGLVYDMVTNFKVPVNWAINPGKTTYAFNSPASSVDFTATITTGTKSYSGGSFIIDSAFLTPAACTLLVLFAAHLAARARKLNPGIGAGPAVLIGGSILWASGLLLGSTLELADATTVLPLIEEETALLPVLKVDGKVDAVLQDDALLGLSAVTALAIEDGAEDEASVRCCA